jgi:fatty-acyl-CoA synthase
MDVQVVAVPDEKYGEEIAAIIKVKSLESNELTGDDILQVCRNHIAHYKIPKYVLFVTDYPLTVTGKIQKYLIRAQL